VLKHKGVIEANRLRHHFFVKVLLQLVLVYWLQVKEQLPLLEIELLFWTYWRPATQTCDLEGHDVPLNVRCISNGCMLRLYMCGKLLCLSIS